MTIDPLSFALGVTAALPLYWFIDRFIVPRLAHVLYVARFRERV